MSEEIQEYVKKLAAEKESLIAKFLDHTGLSPLDVCLVERQTETGRVFYPDLKSKYDGMPDVSLPD